MPDLLTHALVAYSICMVLSWRFGWITPGYVTVGMAGAFIPDMAKVSMVLPDAAIEGLLGLPFDWFAVHTLGGAAVAVVIGTAVVPARERRRVAALLAVGAGSHLVADTLLLKPTGQSFAVLWPLTRWHPPTPGLYLSTEPTPTVVAGLVAVGVWGTTRWYRGE